jgi:hypothetical protein
MRPTQYRIFVESRSDSDDHPESESLHDSARYTNIIEEEGFEEDPEGFEGLQKGSEIVQGGTGGPVPWDPSESFFAYI